MATFEVKDYMDRKKAGLYLLAENIGKEMEGTAK